MSDLFTKSDKFTSSSIFEISDSFTKSDKFTGSSILVISNSFTKSDDFTRNSTFTPSITSTLLESTTFAQKATKKITVSISLSLTYVNRKSVSFSYSFVASNTFEMSYDEKIRTYTMVITQTNYKAYFPYIIYYLSPMYFEKSMTIDLTSRKTISPKQLIGVVCGSVSVFFLVLGIIIFALRKKTETQNLYDDYEDYSCSTDVEIIQRVKETNRIDLNENQDTIGIIPNEFSEIS